MTLKTWPNIDRNTIGDVINWIKDVTRIRDEDVGDYDGLRGIINGFFPPGQGGDAKIVKDTPLITLFDTAGGSANYRIFVYAGQFGVQTVDDDGVFIASKLLIDANAVTFHLKSADSTIGGLPIAMLDANKAWHPPSLTNAAGQSNSIFYSTTDSKLVYKDPGGTIRALY